eukprot:TRINITY_DN2412_c0_g1_i1.p2 TRINITY_DN2412_c0_g1~~TRINITY_DN2412_c0_g1_i1.p2  ORF type:complete len:209 (+),score=74.79 TRINITY_DN2412_c0_g1_i1:58-684(+)
MERCEAPHGMWPPATAGKRWEGDDGVSLPPIAAYLEEHGVLDCLQEFEQNEVYTLETLMLLTEQDLVQSFSQPNAMKIAAVLGKGPMSTIMTPQQSVILQMSNGLGNGHGNMPADVPPNGMPPHGAPPAWQSGQQLPSQVTAQQVIEVVQQLVEERERARRVKDYSKADAIREQLRKHGIKLNDDSRTWLQPNGQVGGTWGKHDSKVR